MYVNLDSEQKHAQAYVYPNVNQPTPSAPYGLIYHNGRPYIYDPTLNRMNDEQSNTLFLTMIHSTERPPDTPTSHEEKQTKESPSKKVKISNLIN